MTEYIIFSLDPGIVNSFNPVGKVEASSADDAMKQYIRNHKAVSVMAVPKNNISLGTTDGKTGEYQTGPNQTNLKTLKNFR